MKSKKTFSQEQVYRTIAYAISNSRQRAQRISADYIKLNPQEQERRTRDLEIELLGIDNLYFEVLRQLEAINNPYGEATT